MLDAPKTVKEALKIKYGRNAYRKGDPYDKNLCAYEVWNGPLGMASNQCSRKNGHGSCNLYCKQHAKRLEASK